MIVGRVILYDRLYYHHKVRAAEAMVRKLIEVVEQERGRRFTLSELFFGLSDDAMVDLLSGKLHTADVQGGGERARGLGQAVQDRELYHRAFAVAQRFIGGLDGLPEKERDDVRIYRWGRLLDDLADPDTCGPVEREIYTRGQEMLRVISDLKPPSGEFRPE